MFPLYLDVYIFLLYKVKIDGKVNPSTISSSRCIFVAISYLL